MPVQKITLGSVTRHAPLEVTLAPYPLLSPHIATELRPQLRRDTRTAAAIETQGSDVGAPGLGNAPAGKPEEPTPPLPGIDVPRYYPPEELTQRATIVRDLDPYLSELENASGSGTAILRLWINEHGSVDRVDTESTTLPEAFARVVVEGFMAAQFKPAERVSIAVKSQMRVEVKVLPRPP